MARIEQGRTAAWWLGEYANMACGEVAGAARDASRDAVAQENGREASALESVAMQVVTLVLCASQACHLLLRGLYRASLTRAVHSPENTC